MRKLFFFFILIVIIAGCANMDSKYIDGGWFDEDPPKVVSSSPTDKSINVNKKKITIVFNEYIKIDNANENVIVSPPQIEPAEIKASGKKIEVELKDSLKKNTTYTVDFSNSITDNNEGNPLGNYTYSFSTGNEIDTLEVGGYVIDSETLEPIQGILVGLYPAESSDSIFLKEPFLRVSRSDSRGHFIIKGVKKGEYKIYALKDQDNNFMLTPNSGEMLAFYNDTISPYVFDDIRQDTTMLDSMRIKSIEKVSYKHFMPDNIILLAFSEPKTDRVFIKSERSEDADNFTLYFSYGDSLLPDLRGLNFNSDDAFLIESNQKKDSITYWLRDTALVNQDTLRLKLNYRMSDTLGVLRSQTDTLEILAKNSYKKRLKEEKKEYDTWFKKEQKKKKRGEPYDSIMPPQALKMDLISSNEINPDDSIAFSFKTPLEKIDTSKIHLYIERDTLWYNADFGLTDLLYSHGRTIEFTAEWQPECEYSLELDSAAFTDIYGKLSRKIKQGFKVKGLDKYGTFELTMPGMEGKDVIVQLLETNGNLAKESYTNTGKVKFFYLLEKGYYMRAIVDKNNNHMWDTGKYLDNLQPEDVYYYPKEIKIRAKWNITETWNLNSKPRNEQKPSKLVKSKEKKKTLIKGKNQRRAKELEIELPEYLK